MISHIFFYPNGTTICQSLDAGRVPEESEPWFLPVLRDKLTRGVACDATQVMLPNIMACPLAQVRQRFPLLPDNKLEKAKLARIFFYPNGNLGSTTSGNLVLNEESEAWFVIFLRERLARGVIDGDTIVRVPFLPVGPVWTFAKLFKL